MVSFFLDLMTLVPLIGYLFAVSGHIADWILVGNLKSLLEMFRRVRRGRRALKNKKECRKFFKAIDFIFLAHRPNMDLLKFLVGMFYVGDVGDVGVKIKKGIKIFSCTAPNLKDNFETTSFFVIFCNARKQWIDKLLQ